MLPRPFTDFIRRHHVMTLATQGEEGVHCSHLFYAYLPGENLFAFTSDHATIHGRQALANPSAAASIVLETKVVGKIQGLQMRGQALPAEGETRALARAAYLKRFPYAALHDLELWTFRPEWIKMTDNTLGFGKKLIWTPDEE